MVGSDLQTRSNKSIARVTGLFYLAIIVLGIWSEMAVRDLLIVPDNGPQTLANIMASGGLFSLSLVADIGMILSDIAVGVLLYLLFRQVAPRVALAAMILRLTQAIVLAANLLFQVAAMVLLRGEHFAEAFGADNLAWAVQALLELQGQGYDLGLIFFGINCLLTAWLIMRSGIAPRLVGLGIAASGLVYLSGSGFSLLTGDQPSIITMAYLIPLIAELAFAIWLAVGARGRTAPQHG
ncbi:DUF4386 domain-containing protein [Devosia salina]|uniref:DUF4386 domain-containing protein n=1 Tax=Devosia salina TaxID=2860336 RepID=A0ABX8WBF6_9HYPH|nr:DUF4386 domain-containing protein [Devosia salina]QYO76285.1 DUF4386 domain-containing protein [Devosia salina]